MTSFFCFNQFNNSTTRTHIINYCIRKLVAKKYLEIGVRCGDNFFNIECYNKIGVDPNYFFAKRKLLQAYLKPHNWFLKMYKLKSNEFFHTFGYTNFNKKDLDVVFIDGLHTYEQSFNDCINSLVYLGDDGIVILHDCNPTNKIAAQKELPKENINWNGDVWKTIYHFRQHPHLFECFTINADQGIGILRFRNRPTDEQLLAMKTESKISNLSYDFLASDRKRAIGLNTFE